MSEDKILRDAVPSTRWGQERRMEFIEFRLLWEGRINRSDLTSFFGISVPQASADLTKYQGLAPGNLVYDKQAKAYVAGSSFRMLATSLNPYAFLNAIRQVDGQMVSKDATFLGWVPDYSVVRLPTRRIEVLALRDVLHSIRTRTRLGITYQSMNRPLPTERFISPHAIAFDGVRWHVRGYCFERNEFRDFVMSRMSAVITTAEPGFDSERDLSWATELDVVVEPAPHLHIGQRRAVELDYGMIEGRMNIRVREAMILYLLHQLPLYGSEGRLRHNHLVLANHSELQPTFKKLNIDF